MQWNWRVGSLFGIPVIIDLSWFLILAGFMIYNGRLWQSRYPEWGVATAWGTGLAATLLLLASVLLHELGHSLVAKAQGLKNPSVSLFLFGGIATTEQEAETAGKLFQLAFAGPAISLSLAATLYLLTYALPGASSPFEVLVANLALINLVVALFNLLPGLPLDGGQLLKAAVWKVTNDRLKGERFAAKAGEVLGWLTIALGIADTLKIPHLPLATYVEGWWLVLLGWFGLQAARAYNRTAELQMTLLKIKAADAMTQAFELVDINLTLGQFTRYYLSQSSTLLTYFAYAGDRHLGLVKVEELNTIERSLWEVYSLAKILQPLSSLVTVKATLSLVNVIQVMETHQLGQVPVLSSDGIVIGMLDRGDIVRTVAQALDIRISDSMIQQIKVDGAYPASLPLPAIARNLASGAESTPSTSELLNSRLVQR
jgi:Zn-dependent protease